MRVALYERNGYQSVWKEESAEWLAQDGYYVRVSEFVEVEFTRLPPEEVVSAQLTAIDAEEQELRMWLADQLADLNDRRAKLRAIGYEPAPAPERQEYAS